MKRACKQAFIESEKQLVRTSAGLLLSGFVCTEDKERYEKELEALPAEKKAKLSRKGAKKSKKARTRAVVRPA